MQKLPMHTKNIADENFKKLAELFPQAVTEVIAGHDENGKPIIERAIDKDVLMAEIAAKVVDGPSIGENQRYQFTWPDKAKTVHASNQPIYKTLRPCCEESVNFDDTENLYIEGDNLEVLKLLQESYLGKVKMIYIDPPYNTGNDFVYNDRFTMDGDEWDEVSGDYDEEGNRLFKNTDSNGRFHTDWLNMLYPRLKIARDLLNDDGVIFISIDDNEAHNLKKICDEIFGLANFVADISVVNNLKGRNDKKYIARANERLLMYVKSQNFSEHGLPLSSKTLSEYKEEDEYGKYRLIELRKRGGPDTKKERPNMYYPFYVNASTGDVSLERCENHTIQAFPIKSNGVDGRWRWGKLTAKQNINFLYGKKVGDKYNIYEKDYLESHDGARRVKPKSVLFGSAYSTDVATKEYRAMMKAIDFNNPKPVALLSDLITYATCPDEHSIILDFFSGSATTAHAVMQLNAEDGGKRKFIMVQWPEDTDENSEAFKAGYTNICEIGKERIRRAGAKVKEKAEEENKSIPDIGFRVLKVDSSHFADNVARTPSETTYKTIMESVDNIKHDRSPEDLLFYAMHQLGIPLSSKIMPVVIQDKKVFEVYYADMLYLTASFDKNLTESIITEIAQKKPLYFAMRDNSPATDSVATNFDEIFKLYSPSTERWVL